MSDATDPTDAIPTEPAGRRDLRDARDGADRGADVTIAGKRLSALPRLVRWWCAGVTGNRETYERLSRNRGEGRRDGPE